MTVSTCCAGSSSFGTNTYLRTQQSRSEQRLYDTDLRRGVPFLDQVQAAIDSLRATLHDAVRPLDDGDGDDDDDDDAQLELRMTDPSNRTRIIRRLVSVHFALSFGTRCHDLPV